ncbi:MAG: cyclic-di-AMP receptor [Candidatus Wallacebacter cryptica]|jgi:uncharacterized protein YaaQ|nr:hypothetical protein [Bacillota bacterium]
MKLIIIVVEDDDAPNLIRELSAEGYSSTKLASTGGFLLHGNTTLLVGVKDEQVDPVIDIVKRICVRRKKIIPQAAAEIPTSIHLPIEIEVGGAILFVVDVEEFHRM